MKLLANFQNWPSQPLFQLPAWLTLKHHGKRGLAFPYPEIGVSFGKTFGPGFLLPSFQTKWIHKSHTGVWERGRHEKKVDGCSEKWAMKDLWAGIELWDHFSSEATKPVCFFVGREESFLESILLWLVTNSFFLRFNTLEVILKVFSFSYFQKTVNFLLVC